MFLRSMVISLNRKKLWCIFGIALSVAAILISVTFIHVVNNSNGIKIPNIGEFLKKNNIFTATSYYCEYEVTTISNKNKNTYNMKEWYKKNLQEYENFRFEHKTSLGDDIIYLINNESIKVKNTSQKSEYVLSEYMVKKSNLISVATFTNLYNKINNKLELFQKYNITIASYTNENKIHNYIDLSKAPTNLESEIYAEAFEIKDIVNKVSKIELVLDSDNKKPVELNVYDKKGAIWIAVSYMNFEINTEIKDEIFAI